MNLKTLKEIWASGRVRRFHTVPTDAVQTIADHTWGVMALLYFLTPNPSAAVLKAALYHDCAEIITGDIPAHTKWEFPEYAAALDRIEQSIDTRWGLDTLTMTVEDVTLLKIADLVELYLYCQHREGMGDKQFQEIRYRVVNRLESTHSSSKWYPQVREITG